MKNGSIQTGSILAIYMVDLLILLCLKPFSNTIVQCIATLTVSPLCVLSQREGRGEAGEGERGSIDLCFLSYGRVFGGC